MPWVEIKNRDELEAFYLSVIPKIKEAARHCGYAIGVHGSLRRDLDLIAVPWTENYSDKNRLAEHIQRVSCGFTMTKYDWEIKPHGRMATAFPICTVDHKTFGEVPLSLCHVDLSVFEVNSGTSSSN